ncbi:MAG: asparagine synthetase B [Pseudomonadota bacterium]
MGAVFGYGFHTLPACQAVFDNMARALEFRGRQAEKYTNPVLSMGVMKHSYEQGPRLIVDEERAIIAACEGEIYNTKELFETLCSLSGKPENSCGFDLVPYLYSKKGKDFARVINGVFAIALWDVKLETLFLVRDHLGSHSLFYALENGFFCFSTTIRAIISTGYVSSTIDYSGLNAYLSSLAIPPPDTMFKTISAVRPGHVTIVRQDMISEHSYWPVQQITEDLESANSDFADRIRDLFVDAVTIRDNKGGTSGALISGGIDTSAIASVLCANRLVDRLKGFSIVFEEHEYSDASLQEHMYGNYEISPYRTVLTPQNFADALVTGAAHLDNPVNDVAYAGMLVAMDRAAKEGCNFVFEGEGSDEIFTTGHSRSELSVQRFLRLPFQLRHLILGWAVINFPDGNTLADKMVRFLGRLGMSDLQRRSTWIPGLTRKQRQQLLGDFLPKNDYSTAESYYRSTRLKDAVNIYQYGLARLFLPDDLLFKNERMAAARGILNRTPFIDYRLVEEGFRIPAKFKLTQPSRTSDGTKLIFKQAIRGMIPHEILSRKKKRGFSQPSGLWFRGPLKSFVHDHLFSRDSKVTHYLDQKEVRRLYERHMKDELSGDYFLNSILILELWMRHYL